MLYLDNITSQQSLSVPLYTTPSGTSYQLLIKRNTTGGQYVTVTTTAYANQYRLYANLTVTLPSGLTNGEYEYVLKENGSIVGGGILSVGGARYADVQHEQEITYKEYEPNQI